MNKLSAQQFEQLSCNAKVIEKDSFGKKVLLLPDNNYIKLFRVKRLFTSARLIPYSKRFKRNAIKLANLGIPTITIKSVFNVPSIERSAVHYAPLKGEILRSPKIDFNAALTQQLGLFICELHDKGIYFRSLHLGNIVKTPTGELGLIDIADMKFYNKPLSEALRVRNLHHLCRYEQDKNSIMPNLALFISGYGAEDDLKSAIAGCF